MGRAMKIRNEDIREILVEIPEGHKHIRTVITLQDGSELVFQEAAIKYYQGLYNSKTHPQNIGEIKGTHVAEKAGYADWQLLEE
jgi:hypothetical protein